MVYIFTIQKISLYWGPVQPFLNIDHDFGHICFLKKLWNFFGTKSGSYSGQKIISFSLGVFFDWEISIYFCPLFVHFRTQGNTLTYSAVIDSFRLEIAIASPSFASLLWGCRWTRMRPCEQNIQLCEAAVASLASPLVAQLLSRGTWQTVILDIS